ncbi:hypothetical protein M0R45_009569 [Rubus argutus]|uniref:Cytochrome P450 n=1 Tax=Rubus argutus TaxID=59490 RepID=A0AAW1Y5A6_RUBAR
MSSPFTMIRMSFPILKNLIPACLIPFSFLGFGSGQRMCPGINLAKLEISVFIHHLVCKYKRRPLQKDDSVQPTLVRIPKRKYLIAAEPL